MIKTFLLISLIIVVHCSSWFPSISDNKCKFTRSDALTCAIKYGDLNNDQRLTQNEVKHALDTLIPSYLNNVAFRWISGLSPAGVMKDCDYNKDGVITPRDWELDGKQEKPKCMPTQENLCTFKWFCDYANNNKKK